MIQKSIGDIEQFDFGGILIKDFTADENLSASLAYIEIPPGIGHPRAQSTKSDKYYFCTSGSAMFRCGNREVQLNASGLLVIQANEWFEYWNDSRELARLLLFHVPPFDLNYEVFAE